MRALVTGGAGFIGSNLVDYLYDNGHDVVALDNESAESNEKFYWKKRGVKNQGDDITNLDCMKSLFNRESFDVVFHLAAESRIQPTLENPVKACKTNFLGTCNLLQAAREAGTKRFVYSSTSSAYGLKNEPPLTEDMPNDCLNPYSVTKVAAEDLCKMYHSLFGMETVIFRYFNVYGERQPLRGQYAPVVGIFLRQKGDGEPMTIVGDGLQRRDFTHVKDVVKANILAATSTDKELFGEILNVGTGRNHSVKELADLIGGEQKHIDSRPAEAAVTLADNSKIKRLLGWEPEVVFEDWIANNNV